jgi:ribosomal protein L32
MLMLTNLSFVNFNQVTNMKKKRKHISYVPKAKGWNLCQKCGEAKLPHRICKTHLEVCAMSDEEWQEKKLTIKKLKEQSSSE